MLKYNEEKIMRTVRRTIAMTVYKFENKLNKQMRKLNAQNMSKEERQEELDFVRRELKKVIDIIQRNLDL